MYKRILRSEQPKYDELILSFMIKDHRYDLMEDLFLKKKNLTLEYFFIQNIRSLEVNDITLKTMVTIIKKYDGYSLEQFAPFVDIMFINKKKEFHEVKEILATHKSCSASALLSYMEVLEKENKDTIKTLVDRMDKSDKYRTKYLCQLITKSPFFDVEMNYSEEGQISLK